MNLFPINHPSGGPLTPCICEKTARRDYVDRNWINLDTLTAVVWEDGMWLIYFGDTYYRVHDKEKMKALEEALLGG